MPQWRGVLTSDLTEEGASKAIRFKIPLSGLGRLASALPTETWNRRHQVSKPLDSSTDRASRWCDVAEALLEGYKCKHPPAPSDVKKEIYHWLMHKYSVLSNALRRGDILQIDVLDAVVRRFFSDHFRWSSPGANSELQLEIDVLQVEKRFVRQLLEISRFDRQLRRQSI